MPEPQTKADYGELLRTIGFSSSPGVLRVAGIIPMPGAIVNLVVGIWMPAAMVIAVMQALDSALKTPSFNLTLVECVALVIQVVFLAAALPVREEQQP